MSGSVVVQPRGDGGEAIPGAGKLAMTVFLVSLSVLFAGAGVAYLVVRSRAEVWPPPGAPALPRGLWVGTLLLVACSVVLQRALGHIRRGDQRRLVEGLEFAGGLAVLFLLAQAWCWWAFFHAATFHAHLYGFTFYMLTGLHGLHVLGGLAALGFVTFQARRRAYTWAGYGGVRHCVVYWHFLGAAWVGLLALLLAG